MKRFIALFMCAIMTLVFVAGCNTSGNVDETQAPDETSGTETANPAQTPEESDSAEEKILIVRASSDPISFNPNGSADDPAFNIVSNIYSQLVRLDTTRQIIPDLATEWQTSEDGLTMTFKLVENATFHDGVPVTAEDVAYTFNYIITHDTCLMYNRFSAQIESVEAQGDYTAVFHLKNPYAALIGYLGYYGTFIMPKHIFDNGQAWEENPAVMSPIGCGPFKFSQFNPGESIVLVKNENYFKTDVKLDKLIFQQIPDAVAAVQALKSGDIDYLGAVPSANVDELMADSNFVLSLAVLPSPTYICFNFAEEDVLTPAVRLAIAHAINREDISKKVFSGIREPEYNFYPSVVEWASNSNAPAPGYSISEAIAVLEQAGYTKDADGYYVRGITLDCFSTDSSPDVAKLIQGSCKEAGIEIEVIVSEYQAWNQKVSVEKDFMISMQGGFQGPDVSALSGRIGVNGGANYGKYENAEIEQLFLEGMKSTDESVRQPIYYRIQEIMAEELPLVPIVKYASYVAQASYVIDTPIQCAGRAGWIEYSYTDIRG